MTGESAYDVVIVGGGPAGLASAVYTARDRLKTLILEKLVPGGQINMTDRIENYPGCIRITGPELVSHMEQQCKSFGAEIRQVAEVTRLETVPDGRIVVEINGDENVGARAVILSPGSDYRKLGVPGEDRFRQAGAGVSYCGTCDAPFFKDKTVVAVGGGNTAVQEVLHLARFAAKVYIVHRRQEFRADSILVEELYNAGEGHGKIEPVLDTVITSIEGADHVRYVKTRNVVSGREGRLDCDGIFIFVGMIPNTKFLHGFVTLDENGFIVCEPWYMRTSVPGVFVAGDCRVGAAMQLATACGDGVVAAMMVKRYIKDPAWWDTPGP